MQAKEDVRRDPNCRSKSEHLKTLMKRMAKYYGKSGEVRESYSYSYSEEDDDQAFRKKRRLTLQESHVLLNATQEGCVSPPRLSLSDDCIHEDEDREEHEELVTLTEQQLKVLGKCKVSFVLFSCI